MAESPRIASLDDLRPAARLPRRPHLPARVVDATVAAAPAGGPGGTSGSHSGGQDMSLDLVALLTPLGAGKPRRGAA